MRVDHRHEPVCIKFHALAQWAVQRLGTIDHERRVASVATTLFDLTGSLHNLDSSDLRLLKMAAMVHDVGRAVDAKTHPEQGARMLREHAQLPLTGRERRYLAFLTRYHKGRVPPRGTDRILRRKDDANRLRMLLSLLRAADALDSRSAETPCLQFGLEGRRLRVICRLDHDTVKARRVYTRRKKFRLLEEMLGCRVEVIVKRAHAMRLVA